MEVIWQASDTVSFKNSMYNVCQNANSFFAPNLAKKIFRKFHYTILTVRALQV